MRLRIKGKYLKKLNVDELVEVFKTNEDGMKTKSLGCFLDENIAKAFAQIQPDSAFFRTERRFVLTDGMTGFVIGEEIVLNSDEQAAIQIKKKAISKLSPEERKIFGI